MKVPHWSYFILDGGARGSRSGVAGLWSRFETIYQAAAPTPAATNKGVLVTTNSKFIITSRTSTTATPSFTHVHLPLLTLLAILLGFSNGVVMVVSSALHVAFSRMISPKICKLGPDSN
ncbi:hypothetical protein V7S43_009113 [Phytophthora oleae]|uniref:Uncharacterized protein n=1 Tax=Phytophthora oleae TaxID=2107226 RepID=A0ABD3FIY8_9STRA